MRLIAIIGLIGGIASFAESARSSDPVELFAVPPESSALPDPTPNTGEVGVPMHYPVVPNVRGIAELGARGGRLGVRLPQGVVRSASVVRATPQSGFLLHPDGRVEVDPRAPTDAISFSLYAADVGIEVSLSADRGKLFGHVSDVLGRRYYTLGLSAAASVLREIVPGVIPLEPPDVAETVSPRRLGSASAVLKHRPKTTDRIDVLMLYTSHAMAARGGQVAFDGFLKASWENLEHALASSDIVSVSPTRLAPNGLGALPIGYDEASHCFDHACVDAKERFRYHKRMLRENAEVRALRDQHAADLIVAFVADQTACGIAYNQQHDCGQQTGEPQVCDVGAAYNDFAFAVVSVGQNCANWNFAHEVGHMLGMEHDPASGAPSQQASFTWSYGHSVSNAMAAARDLMAYESECASLWGGCPVTIQFSNPNIGFMTFPTVPSGTAVSDSQGRSRFNARTATLFSDEIANFRGAVTPPRLFRNDFESLPDVPL